MRPSPATRKIHISQIRLCVQAKTSHRQIGLKPESQLSPSFAAVITRARLAVECTALLLNTCSRALHQQGPEAAQAAEASKQLQSTLLAFLQSVANTPLPKPATSEGVYKNADRPDICSCIYVSWAVLAEWLCKAARPTISLQTCISTITESCLPI